MKKLYTLVGSLLITTAGQLISSTSDLHFPKLIFTYDWRSHIMDAIGSCVMWNNPPLLTLKKELNNELPHLKAAWEYEAPLLFEEIFSLFGRGIKTQERTAFINLSHG